MNRPTIAVVSFPGNNCEVESMRAVKEAGMDALFFRWNDDREKLKDVDGYFIPGGFTYEDRGRSGMVAARDPLMDFIRQEAEQGKVVIGNCNGAQILVESGLIPLGNGLQMSLARNAVETSDGWQASGFLSEWVWITPSCQPERCVTSDWKGVMHLPIAHGEGRFTTKDKDLIDELRKNDQIAFSYCDAEEKISMDPVVTPNGSMFAIAGICNSQGNVVALMPHPERSLEGGPYFVSVKRWIENKRKVERGKRKVRTDERSTGHLQSRTSRPLEIFIDTIITNNEERTVEKAARKYAPGIILKQWKYLSPTKGSLDEVLADLSIFNPNKERAFIRRSGTLYHWNSSAKREEKSTQTILNGIALLRRDIPDTGASGLGEGSETGICYVCSGVEERLVMETRVLQVFSNPHASTLERLH